MNLLGQAIYRSIRIRQIQSICLLLPCPLGSQTKLTIFRFPKQPVCLSTELHVNSISAQLTAICIKPQ